MIESLLVGDMGFVMQGFIIVRHRDIIEEELNHNCSMAGQRAVKVEQLKAMAYDYLLRHTLFRLEDQLR